MLITHPLSLIAAISLFLTPATIVSAGTFQPIKPSTVSPYHANRYIVEYESNVGHRLAQTTLTQHAVDYHIHAEFGIFNGASIEILSEHSGPALANIPGIKTVWPLAYHARPDAIPLPPPPPPSGSGGENPIFHPTLQTAHSMTGVTVLHNQFGYSGTGIKVGVIDTGIDYTHPALGGCFGPGCRVAYGYDFVGDAYTADKTPVPDSDPKDCEGHGTHVSGIIGANALNIQGLNAPFQPFVGVAPNVTFGAYRIFGCEGGSSTEIILKAMERAFTDGMDIINMSLGGGSSYKSNPEAVLAEQLTNKGISVIAAAGNDGADGLWMVSDVGLGDSVSSIASFDNVGGFYYTLTYGKNAYAYTTSQGYGQNSINLPANATLAPLLDSTGQLVNGCVETDYEGINVKGKVVLALGESSACTSADRGQIAIAAGAVAVLMQSVPYGMENLAGIKGFPEASIEFGAGNELVATYKTNPKTIINWSKTKSEVKVEGGGSPSVFSSWGLDGELRQKPDFGAPGGNIFSTFPLAKGGYQVLSGTSMATPYVAGSHALFLQAKGQKFPGNVIRDVFKNTASNTHFVNQDTWVPTIKQGAGLINVLAAIQSTSSLLPSKIDLLDTLHFVKTATLTLTNNGRRSETYTLSHVPSDAVLGYDNSSSTFPSIAPVMQPYHAAVVFDSEQVIVRANASVQITITFTEPDTGDASIWPLYSGFIVATPLTPNVQPLHVPYAGLKGDVSRVPIMDTAFGAPTMVMFSPTTNVTQIPTNHVFDFTTEQVIVVTRMGSHSPDFSIKLYDDQTFVGYAVFESGDLVSGPKGRDSNLDDDGNTKVVSRSWTGLYVVDKTTDPKLATPLASKPTTGYSMQLELQRKLTEGNFPADYEVYNLGTILF